MPGPRIRLVYQRILFTYKADVFRVNLTFNFHHVCSSDFTARTDVVVSAAAACVYIGALPGLRLSPT